MPNRLVRKAAGRVYVNAIARSTIEQKLTRELVMGAPVPSIVLLDTDRQGIIDLGVTIKPPAISRADGVAFEHDDCR